MEWIWIITGILLVVVGLAGSLLPALPGPPLAYAGLLVQQLRAEPPFTTGFLVFWGIVVAITILLDYIIPVWTTKLSGGSKYGMWGCTLGFLAAFWMGPWGILLGPLAGAFIGEYIFQKNTNQALRAAIGSFAGFLAGSFLKLILCLFMLYYVLAAI
jgi:uncharacterized protein YqgC (DUF456 family)